jgi:phosphate acyltransferase
MRGESVMLDLGGSLAASSKNLVDFAVMGDTFARHVLGLTHPSIGLLNVGHESSKGTDSLKEAAMILKSLPLNFVGFIEGDDICKGVVDVIVTDGFSGNIALKTAEGVIRMVFSSLKKTFGSSKWGKVSGYLAKPFLTDLKNHFDPRTYNGAIWLGLRGVAIKSHGGTDALGFAHALEMTHDMVLANVHLALEKFLSDAFVEKAVAL